jgi:regulator of protease activity HflC (stomatin/prohibitin superfamily)
MISTVVALGGLVALGVIGEYVLRGVIDDRIENGAADLPSGVTVTQDRTPALWQVTVGQTRLRIDVPPEALTASARSATGIQELNVVAEQGNLVAQMPLPLAGGERTADILLSVAAEDGQVLLRADTVRIAGLNLPVAALAERLDNPQLDRLADGVTFPEGEGKLMITSARATANGLELEAEVAM